MSKHSRVAPKTQRQMDIYLWKELLEAPEKLRYKQTIAYVHEKTGIAIGRIKKAEERISNEFTEE